MLQGKHIVLGVSGGIAAYKSVSLLRLLVKADAEVQVIMTPSGKEFVAPLTFSSLSGKPVISEFFTANTGEWHSHVDLGLWADLMIIAPATASTIAKMATGVADNMLITTYLSAKEDVMVAPAMDLDMYRHPSTQRNLSTLQKDGVLIVEAEEGELASGLTGKGRMAEPETIFKEICRYFTRSSSLKGKKVLITAGPTFENIDPVRFIGNWSSGKMGFSLAEAFAERGAEVVLVTGPVSLPTPAGTIKRVDVVSAKEMLTACEDVFENMDITVFAAAVADYAPEVCSDKKIKREETGDFSIKLKKNPDIAKTLGKSKKDGITIGFALETNDELKNAQRKLESKNLDAIVMNSLNDKGAGFMVDTNKVTVITSKGDRFETGLTSKKEIGNMIAEIAENLLTEKMKNKEDLK